MQGFNHRALFVRTSVALLPPKAKELESALLSGVLSPTFGMWKGAMLISTVPEQCGGIACARFNAIQHIAASIAPAAPKQ
jgi:hypothetical protein